MNDWHMIGLDKILHDEFPVGRDLAEIERRNRLDLAKVDVREAVDQRCGIILEGRRVSIEINKYPVVPYGRPYGLETMVGWIKSVGLMVPETVKMW